LTYYYYYYYCYIITVIYTYLNAVLLKVSEVSDDQFCFVIDDGSLIKVMHVAAAVAAITKPEIRTIDRQSVIIEQRRIQR